MGAAPPAEASNGDDLEGDSLSCWYTDPSGGQGFSYNGDTVGGTNGEYVCASFCLDCAQSPDDDTAYTNEQRDSGAKLSFNSIVPLEYLGGYEALYANFASCQTDDCNKVDACDGEAN